MPASIGVNLRVTGHCRQGGRKYMEDFFSVAYQQTEDERDLEYAFFGIYDGHGGAEAAAFAKERLMEAIVRHKFFWSDNDEDVLRAIKLGYIATHYAMWKEQDKWPKTASGLPSTAGTTASIAFIRHGKIYVGHVGDSAIVLGYQEPGCSAWKAKPLTRDHKPESAVEMSRIKQCGGKVVSKSGVPRVVWNRPRIGHKGPVRRSTPIDEIPFLAVARSLGDLWSYNSEMDEFVVSPDPDCSVIPIDTATFRCLIFGTDGLYNMLSPQMAVHIVQQAEKHNEEAALSDTPNKIWLNPSKCLVERALKLWSTTKMRADNTSVVTLMLDPPGPPRAQVLRNRKKAYPDSGLQILTRYEEQQRKEDPPERTSGIPEHNPHILKSITSYRTSTPTLEKNARLEDDPCPGFDMERSNSFVLKPRESLSFDSNESKEEKCNDSSQVSTSSDQIASCDTSTSDTSEENIQINEISSSSNEHDDDAGDGVARGNLRRNTYCNGKIRRCIQRTVNKNKLELKLRENGKRRLSQPSEERQIKRTRSFFNVDVTKHNLRVRKGSTNEVKKSEEMVNQVDSTNKVLDQKRNANIHNQISVDSIIQTRKGRLCSGIGVRASQRVKRNEVGLKSKPKLSTKLLKCVRSKAVGKVEGIIGCGVISKTRGERLKRSFHMGYLRKLRRNVSSRKQVKK